MIATRDGGLAKDFSPGAYRFGWSVALIFAGLWFWGILATSCGLIVEWLLITGQHWFGSANWPRDGIIRAFVESESIDHLRAPMLLAVGTLCGTVFCLERNPLVLVGWSLACVATHIMLVGALF